MEKKEYIKPEMNVFKADMQTILAGTQIEAIKLERADEFNYTDDQVQSLWDDKDHKTIWAD